MHGAARSASGWGNALPRFGPSTSRFLTAGLIAVAAVAVGLATAIIGPLLPLAMIAAGIFAATVARPALAAYVFLALTPFLAGMQRGALVPLLRPHEALQVFLTAAVVIRFASSFQTGTSPRLTLNRTEKWLIFLAFASFVPPLLWLLVRTSTIPLNDLLAATVLTRFVALYALFRFIIRTPSQVRLCLGVTLAAAAVVAIITVGQVLGLAPVHSFLSLYWAPAGGFAAIASDRGSSTIGNPIATADFLAFALAIALAWAVLDSRSRLLSAAVASVLVLGTISSGQFSGFIALVLVIGVVAVLTRTIRALSALAAPTLLLASLLLWPVISTRLAGFGSPGGLPQSWQVRLDNVTTFYLPKLDDFGFVLGVRPYAVVDAPELWRETIFLESGYVWLLWAGGIPLFIAFAGLTYAALRSNASIARARRDPVGVAGAASVATWIVIVALMPLDPHLTFRGAGDLAFILLALGAVSDTGLSVFRAPPSTGDAPAPPGSPSRHAHHREAPQFTALHARENTEAFR